MARKAYLLAYNVVQFAGWAACLAQMIRSLLAARSLEAGLQGAYAAAGGTASLFQASSLLEVAHAALGLVGGSPANALVQWAGRSNVLFGVVASVPGVQGSAWVGVMLLAWALSEVVRYPWYAASLAGLCPAWLTWLRYTAFIPLYPLGVAGEVGAVVSALPSIAASGLYSVALPNAWNFAFSYAAFLKVALALYPFLWLQLYAFLFRQRSKRLAPAGRQPQRRSKAE